MKQMDRQWWIAPGLKLIVSIPNNSKDFECLHIRYQIIETSHDPQELCLHLLVLFV